MLLLTTGGMTVSRKRKQIELSMVLSVPVGMTKAAAKKEVRSLINEQCNWAADEGEVKVKKLS